MKRTGSESPDESAIEANVTIRRPVEQVFGFYRDFRNLPSILRDVLAIEQIGPAVTRWTIQGIAIEDRSPRWIDLGSGDEPGVPVSWGDVATAYYSTGVGNITVYFRRTRLFRSADILGKLFGPLLRGPFGQRALAYDFAANSALEISSRICRLAAPLGLVTPFQAFGADFVLSLPGCSRVDSSSS
jgi:short subunit dehydrogenase-like uncharacterized protein